MGDTTNSARRGTDGPIELAYLAALRAGPIRAPLTPLPDAELYAPIEIEGGDRLDAAEAEGGGDPAAFPSIVGYRCVGEPAYGGQATVFGAVQLATGQRVAVKVLHGGRYLSADGRERLGREVDALAAIGHPNVVRILDRGRTADGSFFLVTPFVDGRPFDAYAAEARASGDAVAVVRVTARVAAAAAAAHAAGVVHRDLKPSNILVDAGGEPHVIDFGLARLSDPGRAGAAGDPHPTITSPGQIVGSLPWTSPEQAAGRSARLTPASDVYALGVLLFQGLTGRFPYRVDGDLPDVVDRIRRARPHRPSRAGTRWERLDPGAVDAVVLKALAKDPADRYAAADDLRADLERLLDGRPPLAPRPASGHAGRLGVGLAAAGVVAGVAAAILSLLASTRPDARVVPLAMPTQENPFGMRMVRLPAGEFTMGSPSTEDWHAPNERLRRAAVPRPIWVSATEVTRGQFAAVMTGDPGSLLAADANLPMTGVSRAQAEAFCARLSGIDRPGYRLPHEVEWEYACRAGGDRGPFSGTGRLASMGWYDGNSGGRLRVVATKSPNAWGLYDLHGNAREWCGNSYAPTYDVDPRQPAGSYPLLVRGGSYRLPEADCRAASRQPVHGHESSAADADLGFRVVREEPTAVAPD